MTMSVFLIAAGLTTAGLVAVGRRFRGRRRAFVEVAPRYRPFLRHLGLIEADHFLALPAVIVSGHPDRHVGRVVLGTGAEVVAVFLKREHRVPWPARLAS